LTCRSWEPIDEEATATTPGTYEQRRELGESLGDPNLESSLRRSRLARRHSAR